MSRVKICGLTRGEDIEAVNLALPDYIGFVFAQSRRRVDFKTAAALKERLNAKVKAVGVFVNEDISTVSKAAQNGIVDLIQLHGDEDDLYIRKLKESCGCPVIKSVGVGDKPPGLLPGEADYLLFDTLSDQRGGIGKAFDWQVLKGYNHTPYFLAGGISPGNVADAIRLLAPFCVDVSSGVETNGFKDADKIIEMVKTVRRMQ